MKLAHLFLPHSFHHTKAHILCHYSYFSYGFLFLLLGFGIFLVRHENPGILGYASNITVTDIINFTNAERQKSGAPQLKISEKLSKAAQEKAQDMFAKNYWAHYGPNGEKPWDFMKKSGYSYQAAGENLARDFQESNAVVTAWVNSPSHRENLLNKNYQEIGLAVVNGVLLGHETTLVVQFFGKPYRATSLLPETEQIAQVTLASTESPNPTLVAQQKTSPIVPPPVAASPTLLPQNVTTAGVNETQSSPNESKSTLLGTIPINLFGGVKSLSLFVLLFITAFLVVDTIVIRKRGVVRIATHSFAHVAVLVIVVFSILLLSSGKIL